MIFAGRWRPERRLEKRVKKAMSLAQAVLAGDRLALSRLLTLIENDAPQGLAALEELFPHSGRAHWIGVTGPSGAGKSSLVNQLARVFRQRGAGDAQQRVAVVAVDPSSPFSGGAILGDRLRMRDLAGDRGVFVRSMAARGALGGLARTTAAFAQVLDAAGYQRVLIETVGAGQSEVEVARLAHTTVVVEAPGLGDEIQAIKAGLLEAADVVAVNKADRPGAEKTLRILRAMIQGAGEAVAAKSGHWPAPASAAAEAPNWLPPVLATNALDGSGVEELAEAVERHGEHLRQSGDWQQKERQRLQNELDALLQSILVMRWRRGVPDERYQALLEQLFCRRISPYRAATELLQEEA